MFSVVPVFVLLSLTQAVQDIKNESDRSVVLSRRKRFLVYPEGSSLQLVFCLTFPNISPIGDIVLWGYTSALAYELPQDPYSPFNHHADPLHRRVDNKAIYYTNEDGRVLYKRPYERKFIVNPAFAKRSTDVLSSPQFKKGTREKFKIDRMQMHASKNKREFLKSEHMEGRSVEFHRSSRGSLYQKIEIMLGSVVKKKYNNILTLPKTSDIMRVAQTRGTNYSQMLFNLGGDGRQCLLKTLCLVGQTRDHSQGNFLQEILRAVFTLPKGASKDDLPEDYDEAIPSAMSCEEAYPDCSSTSSEPI